jgi:F0F1-type ATP synthase membrane subunit b/b'
MVHGVTVEGRRRPMTTFAADHDTSRQLEELDERMRTAWETYHTNTSQLAGSDYEEAELVSWERLQRALEEVADERERLVGAASAATPDDAV